MRSQLLKQKPLVDRQPGVELTATELRRELTAALRSAKAQVRTLEDLLARLQELEGTGRVVVRYSGTEPLARVMIEAESQEKIDKHIEAIAGAIQGAIGII